MTPNSASAIEIDRARRFVEASFWKYARTMPRFPHFYTLRAASDQVEFEWFVNFTRSRGRAGHFFRQPRVYLDLDGWTYWTMGAPVPETILVNRERTAPEERVPPEEAAS